MIKTIIFDFDGTLADSIGMVMDLYNSKVDEFGSLPVSKDEFTHLRKLGYKKAMKEKQIHWAQLPRMVIAISREMKNHMNEVKPYDGIIDVINGLKAAGHVVGILTSNQEPLVKEFLDSHEFPEFDFLVAEKSIFGKDKALKKILRKRNLDKSSTAYVGDEPRDVTASRKAGIPVIGVSWGLAGVEGFAKAEPDILIHAPKELISAVDSL